MKEKTSKQLEEESISYAPPDGVQIRAFSEKGFQIYRAQLFKEQLEVIESMKIRYNEAFDRASLEEIAVRSDARLDNMREVTNNVVDAIIKALNENLKIKK